MGSVPCDASSRSRSDYLQNECLKVPISEFVGSARTTIGLIRNVASTISKFGNFLGNFRLTNAIADCLDLLDFSADELSWSMSASQNPKGKEKPLVLLYLLFLHNFLNQAYKFNWGYAWDTDSSTWLIGFNTIYF